MTYVGNIENSQHLIYILAMKYECLTCLSTYNTAYNFVIPETFKFAQLYDVDVPKTYIDKMQMAFQVLRARTKWDDLWKVSKKYSILHISQHLSQ